MLAIEEHVDYWDALGWKDPFSSAFFSQRQQEYQGAFGRSRNYTPQLIVDGAVELVGSDEAGAREAIRAAARAVKGAVQLSLDGDELSVKVTGLAAGEAATVTLAIVEAGLVSRALRGENEGRTLAHAPVARSLRLLGEVPATASTAQLAARLAPAAGWVRAHLRAVVFVQSVRTRRVLAAGALRLQ